MKRAIILIFIFLFFLPPAQAQKLDSLWNAYNNNSLPDSIRAQAIFDIASSFTGNNPDTAISLTQVQLKFCQKTKQKKWEAKAYGTLGNCYINKGEYSKAIENHLKALKIRQEIDDRKGVGASLSNIGIVYYSQANYPKALEYYLKSLKIKEELNDKKGIGVSYNNIGVVFYLQKNFDKALEYHFKGLEIRKAINDMQGLSATYNNIGNVYMDQANFEEARKYYISSLKIVEELNDKKGMGDAYSNIGGVYTAQGDYQKALDYGMKSLRIREEIGDKYGASISYGDMGILYNKLADYNSAIKYNNVSLSLAKEIGAFDQERKAYQKLAEAYEMQHNFKEAYFNHKKFKALTDSIYNVENSKQLGDLKTNFEVEKKEAELKIKAEAEQEKLKTIAAEEKKVQQIIIAAVLGVLIIVILFSIFLYKRFIITQRQRNIIREQKTEVELQKTLVEEKQKEIVDSITYAKRIQRAILPPAHFIQNYFPENFIYYQPKDIVAGDFYWMECINNCVFIAAADSTGHGVPGAMVSVVCSNALNRSVKEFGLSKTGLILDKTRELVLETFEKSGEEIKDGMDISLLKIVLADDSTVRNIEWSGANNSLYYIKDNELIELKPDKQPIGNVDNPSPFTTHHIIHSPNSTFYLFTDGYADQFGGEKGKKFKNKQLEKLFLEINLQPLSDQKRLIENTFIQWKGNLEQVDDVTIIGIRI